MSEYLIIDIYSNENIQFMKIKEGEKCFKLWENVLDCVENKGNCKKKFLEWDKCQVKYKKK